MRLFIGCVVLLKTGVIFMSTCPKCQKKLKITDIGQNCPHCGVNMRFYNFDKTFVEEAKQAELSMANVHVKLRKFKTALIGSKLAIARLVLGFLPVVSMLLPVGNISLDIPFAAQEFSVSGLGLYTIFSNGVLNLLMSLMSAPINGKAFTFIMIVLGVYLVAALCAVLSLLFSILSFISIKKMARAICGLGIIGAVCGVVSTVLCARIPQSAVINGGASFGVAAIIVLFGVVFAVNFIIAKNGLPIEFEEGDLERYEIRKKVLKGEIRLEDLPQPIVETAATREIDEQIKKEQQKFIDVQPKEKEVQQ